MVKYSILGPVELREGRVAIGGGRQVTLLGLLLVNANRALSSDQLVEVVWGDQAVGAAPRNGSLSPARPPTAAVGPAPTAATGRC
jgi:DNA-binding SARP family transcriptional activator